MKRNCIFLSGIRFIITKLFVLFAGCLSLLPAGAQTFVINDQLVSSRNARICDIEIDPYRKRICFQSPDDDKLWVCRFDTTIWKLTVPDGKETLIDSTLTPLDQTSNSGEWGFDIGGTYIFYNKLMSRKKYIAYAKDNGLTWTINVLTDEPHRINPHVTRNPADTVAGILYISSFPGNFTKYKFMNTLGQEHCILNFCDVHWSLDEQVVTGTQSNHQVAFFDPDGTPEPLQLTDEYDRCFSKPYMWRVPGENARMFFTVADEEEIRVYKETGPKTASYSLYMSFFSPSSNPLYKKFGSPEPCIYDGKAYITFMASSSQCETACYPGEIWIARIDSAAPLFRMVSDTSVSIRTDPETLATSDSLLVFYTEVDNSDSAITYYRLRKCLTGIGLGIPTGFSQGGYREPAGLTVFPNPFHDRLTVKNSSGKEYFEIADLAGRILWSGREIGSTDFSFLPMGIYFLKIRFGCSTRSFKLIKV
jgi:hypothetical protein